MLLFQGERCKEGSTFKRSGTAQLVKSFKYRTCKFYINAASSSVPEATSLASDTSAFDSLVAGTDRKYVMVSGKGGVGKTSLAASLAVRFAEAGHTTLVVSTDPAHSLGDSLSQVSSAWCGSPYIYEFQKLFMAEMKLVWFTISIL